MLSPISLSRLPEEETHTAVDWEIPHEEGNDTNQTRQTRALPVCNHAHWYTRGVHAEIRSCPLILLAARLMRLEVRSYDDIALGRRQLQFFGELRRPC